MHVRDAVEDDAEALATRVDLPTDAIRQLIHDRTVRVAERERPADAADPAERSPGDDDSDDPSTDDSSTDAPADDDSTDSAADADSNDPGTDANSPGPSGDGATVRGFLAFDADEGAVHVTQVAGGREAVDRLLDEPLRFAANEGMPVEAFVPDSESTVVDAVEAAGFESVGDRPQFDGEPIRRYRLERR